MIKLRDYQKKLKNKTRDAFKVYKRVIMLAPCGAGKTVVATSIIQDSIKKNKKVYFIVHRQELEFQAKNTFKKFGIDSDLVEVHMVQTLANKLDKIKDIPDLIILDENQHSTSKTYRKIFDSFSNSYFLGLSATPCRLSGMPLGNIWEYMVSEIQPNELIKKGYLAEYDYYIPKINVDFSELKIKRGDYNSTDLEEIMTSNKIYGDIIKNYKKLVGNKKTIIYAPNIAYSLKMEKLFTENGYNIKHFDGTTPKQERDKIIEDFRNGKIQILTNVDLIGEGFDVPSCSAILLLRKTQSLSLYIQQSTRALRKDGDTKSIIIDFVGNAYSHGMPTEYREWKLNKSMKCKNKSGEPDILVRQCNKCFKCYSGTNPICPYCGFINKKTKKEIEADEKAELEKITEIKRKEKRKEVGMARTEAELIKLAKERGYKSPYFWAKTILKSRNKKG